MERGIRKNQNVTMSIDYNRETDGPPTPRGLQLRMNSYKISKPSDFKMDFKIIMISRFQRDFNISDKISRERGWGDGSATSLKSHTLQLKSLKS